MNMPAVTFHDVARSHLGGLKRRQVALIKFVVHFDDPVRHVPRDIAVKLFSERRPSFHDRLVRLRHMRNPEPTRSGYVEYPDSLWGRVGGMGDVLSRAGEACGAHVKYMWRRRFAKAVQRLADLDSEIVYKPLRIQP